MANSKYWMLIVIALSVCAGALVLGGLVAGFRQKVLHMGLCFFLAVHAACCCIIILLNVKIDNCFRRLGIHRIKLDATVGSMLMVIASSALIILSVLVALRRYWLLMFLLLSTFTILFFAYDAVMIALKVDMGTKRFEEKLERGETEEAVAH